MKTIPLKKTVLLGIMIIAIVFVFSCNNYKEVANNNSSKNNSISNRSSVPDNPYLIKNSFYPIVHYNSAQTDEIELSYGSGGDRKVSPDEINFQAGGLGNPGLAYRKYADGKETIITSGPGRVAKYRFDGGKLKLINEILIPGHEKLYLGHEEIQNLVEQLNDAGTDDEAFVKVTKAEANRSGISQENWPNGMYVLLDKDGYYYAGYGTFIYKFGDTDPTDPLSPLKIVASKDIRDDLPPDLASKVSRFLGINMTYDGYLAVALAGVIGILDRDFKQSWLAPIPGEAVDNGVVVDDKNGLYTVTDKYMRKLVWMGDRLSTDEADGAWKESYDWVKKEGSLSRGSGTTPSLMGFGEDKLVVTIDQGDPVKLVAFWRDQIPADALKVDGAPTKRTAGSIPISFPVKTTIEWSPHVKDYGVMVKASEFPRLILMDDGKGIDLLSTIFTMGTTVPGPRGAERFDWNVKENKFVSKWVYQDKGLSWTLSPVSTIDNMVYLNTTENGEYSLTGVDWDTGEVKRTISLGKSVIFNTGGTFISPLPDGGLYVHGFFGPVRIKSDR